MPNKDDLICREIEAAIVAREGRRERWRQNRDMAYGESENTPAYEGAYTGNFNLIPHKVDALGASVVGVITSVKPYCVAKCYDDHSAEAKLERVVQFFCDLSGLKYALRSVSTPAAWANMGWIKVVWLGKEKRFDFRVLEPDSTLVYPAHVERLEDAKMFGDLKYLRISQIKELVKDGYYKKADLTPTEPDGPTDTQSFRPLHTEAQSDEDREACLFDGYRRTGGEWRKVTIVRETGGILKDEPVEDVATFGCCYGEAGYKPRSPRDGYYPATSVVQDAAQLQLDINATMANLIDGTRMNAFGAFFTTGGNEPSKMVGKLAPGDMWQLDTSSLVPYSPDADLTYLLPLTEALLGQGDRVFRISQMAVGVEAPGTKTATEAGAMIQGQQQSIDEYIENFGRCVTSVFRYVCNVLHLTWDAWFPVYGKSLKLEPADREMFKKHVTWDVNVASAGATPASQMQMLGMLMTYSEDPSTGLDRYEIASRIAETTERMGVTNAQGLQTNRDPVELVLRLAEALEAQGTPVDPETLLAKLAEAVHQQKGSLESGMGGMEGYGGVPPVDAGLGGEEIPQIAASDGMQPAGFAPVAGGV